MSSRDQILRKLRAAQQPFTNIPPVEARHHMVELAETDSDALLTRFIKMAESLPCKVYCVGETEAAQVILKLIGTDTSVLSWSPEHIALPGLTDVLNQAGIEVAAPDDGNVRVGITGIDAALASTGSLIVMSGAGKYRLTSLLPDLHIAVMTPDQILPDLEAWFSQQKQKGLTAFRQSSNTVIITGPSKTADIAQELIKGAHGPREVHIIIRV
jgi:L-lactate dehydrogenase complex protein LldG